MKRTRKLPETSLDRYDWTKARRGRWAGRLRTAHAVLLAPALYEEFGSEEAVVAALEAVVRLREAVPAKKRRRAA